MSFNIVKLTDPIQLTNVVGGLVPKGVYAGGTSYSVGDSVSYNGSSYVCILASTGNLPTDTTYWQVLANKGDTGAKGDTGDTGPTGPAGADGADGADGLTVSVNSVTQVAGDISLTQDNIPDGTTNKAYTAAEQTKLSGIEALADVTDATNVAAAGAVMDGDFSANGVMTRTAAGTYTNRTITGTTNQITVTNGDGVSGNPTLALPNAITLPGTLTITGHTSPQADSTYTLGTSSLYWSNTYTDRLYLNPTAYLDGSTAGTVAITGNVTSTGTGSFTTVTAGTTTDVLGTALTVIRNNVAVGRIDNNASGLRVQAQTGTLQLRGTGNAGIAVSSTGKATFASDIEFSDTASGVILKSPDGTLYRVTVANGGTLAIAAV